MHAIPILPVAALAADLSLCALSSLSLPFSPFSHRRQNECGNGGEAVRGMGDSSVREYVFFVFFQISKKHDFLRFFEMTYQKVVKSHQQKFSPQYVTKE